MDMRFEAKMVKISNELSVEWGELRSELKNDFDQGVVDYFISRRARLEN